jgi:hypothetical protein
MPNLRIRAMGLVWYRREDYPRILEIMTDAELLPRRWEAWHKGAEKVEREAKRSGVIVIRAVIDPDEFPSWCAARDLNVDAKARTEFGNARALKLSKTRIEPTRRVTSRLRFSERGCAG